MKKLLCIVVLALLAVSGMSYAQTQNNGPAIPTVPASAFNQTIVGLPPFSGPLTYGDKRVVDFTPIAPCRLVDTFTDNRFPTTYFRNGDIRTYALSEGGCGGQIPESATDIAVKVTTFGITNMSADWKSPGGRVLFTTLSSPTNSGGVMLDGKLPGFTYFVAGKVLSNSGMVQLREVAQLFSSVKGLGIQVADGETQVIVDVLGYAKTATGAPGATQSNAMVWKGAWSPTAAYDTNDVVKAPNGVWIKTSTGWDMVFGPVPLP